MAKPRNESDAAATPAEPAEGTTDGRPTAENYKTQGQTVVATRVGYAYNDSSGKIPTITSSGIKVSATEAAALVDESNGRVFIVTDNNEEG